MKFKEFINEVRYKPETKLHFKSNSDILDNSLEVELIGLHPERSYEDRDVFVKIKNINKSPGEIQYNPEEGMWLKGEDAIELGLNFIEAGNASLDSNRIWAYEIIQLLGAQRDLNKGIYEKLIIIRRSEEKPEGYGDGFYYFDFFYKGRDPEKSWEDRLIKDVVVYWSPREDEFKKQIEHYASNIPVEYVDWDWKYNIKEPFDRWEAKMNKVQGINQAIKT